MSRLLDTVYRAVPEDAWPPPDSPLVVAVSGGRDSMTLAHLLEVLNRERGCRWRLHVAHLDHGLRPDAGEDTRLIREVAGQRGWPLTVEHRPIRQLAERAGVAVEECAREERYAFFTRVLAALDGEVVATGHHADDHAETILQRLLRGSGLRGLAGIPAVRPLGRHPAQRVIRPLLPLRRQQLAAYACEHDIAWRHDDSNDALHLTRNRLRRELIPQLQSDYNPAFVEALLRLGTQCRWAADYLEDVAGRRLGDIALEIGSDAVTLSARALVAQPRVFQTEIVRRAITVLGCGQKQLTFQHLLAIVELSGRRVSGKRLQLPGLRVIRQRDELRLEPA